MAKVWVCNFTNQFDFTAARKFGDLVPVTKGPQNVFEPQEIYHRVALAMEDYNPAEDMLLLCGHAAIQTCCINFLLSRYSAISTLVFGARDEDYQPVIWRRWWDLDMDSILDAQPILAEKEDEYRAPAFPGEESWKKRRSRN